MKNLVNVSGGVQSTTMFHLSVNGDLPIPDMCICADTGWERKSSYQTVQGLISIANDKGIPFFIVRDGNIREQAIESSNPDSTYPDYRDKDGFGFIKMPVFSRGGNNLSKVRMSKKQCTTDFKIRPMRRFLLEKYGKKEHFNQWIGISLDEVTRMKKSNLKSVSFYYPLVEKRWTRNSCVLYLHKHGIPIPDKSACIGCPLHSDAMWLSLTDEEKQDAIDFDETIRDIESHKDNTPKSKKVIKEQLDLLDMEKVDTIADQRTSTHSTQLFIHHSGRPLRDVLSEETNQQPELFNIEDEECAGMCFI